MWNKLPEEVISAPSVKAFERRLDKAWRYLPFKFNPDEEPPHGYHIPKFTTAETGYEDMDLIGEASD